MIITFGCFHLSKVSFFVYYHNRIFLMLRYLLLTLETFAIFDFFFILLFHKDMGLLKNTMHRIITCYILLFIHLYEKKWMLDIKKIKNN